MTGVGRVQCRPGRRELRTVPDDGCTTDPLGAGSHGRPRRGAAGRPEAGRRAHRPATARVPQLPAPARAAGPPVPSSPQGAPGALIDVPPWLTAPGAPTRAGGTPAWATRAAAVTVPDGRDRRDRAHGQARRQLQRADRRARHGPPDQHRPGGPGTDLPGRAREPAERGGLPPVRRVAAARPGAGAAAGTRRAPALARRRDLAGPRRHHGTQPARRLRGPAGEERPHVVKLPSADGDISRTHLRVDTRRLACARHRPEIDERDAGHAARPRTCSSCGPVSRCPFSRHRRHARGRHRLPLRGNRVSRTASA